MSILKSCIFEGIYVKAEEGNIAHYAICEFDLTLYTYDCPRSHSCPGLRATGWKRPAHLWGSVPGPDHLSAFFVGSCPTPAAFLEHLHCCSLSRGVDILRLASWDVQTPGWESASAFCTSSVREFPITSVCLAFCRTPMATWQLLLNLLT